MVNRLFNFIFIATILGVGFFYITKPAYAATIYVNSETGDDTTGDGTEGAPYATFHKGYTEASADDTLNLTGTFNWADADETGDSSNTGYSISKNLTIQGQGADETFIQADDAYNTADRGVFYITTGVTAVINDVTIRYGNKASGNSIGGGIRNDGTLTINRSSISYNYASVSGQGYGGGIANAGTLNVNDSTINNNFGWAQGGGIENYYTADNSNTANITNSTIAFNTVGASSATVGGSGVYARSGTMYLTNNTIVFNDSINQSSCSGTGDEAVGSGGGTINLKNNLIMANEVDGVTITSITGNCFDVTDSNIIDNGANIFGRVSTVTVAATSWYDVRNSTAVGDGVFVLNDGLGTTTGAPVISTTLGDNSTVNGTQTIAVSSDTSITIDNALATDHGSIEIPTNDQRGFSRNGDTDIGAYEYDGLSPTPTISSLSPVDNATGVSTSANLVMTFDRNVDAESGNIVIYEADDDSVFETIDVTSDKVTGSGSTEITINPENTFDELTEYYVQVAATAFDDSSSNSYAGIADTTSWSFTTGDETSPSVSTLSPSNGASDVAVNTNLIITFSEAVDAESGNITLKKSDNSTVEIFDVTADITGSGTTEITVNPTSDLETDSQYYIQIDATAFDDASGNSYAGISDTTSWSFSTITTSSTGGSVNNIYSICEDDTYINHPFFSPNISICGEKKDQEKHELKDATITPNNNPSTEINLLKNRLTKKGERGDHVKQLQSILNEKSDASLKVDGIFGSLTEDAVKNFQMKNNFLVDGIVGAETLSGF